MVLEVKKKRVLSSSLEPDHLIPWQLKSFFVPSYPHCQRNLKLTIENLRV